jgi:hypothetical protein
MTTYAAYNAGLPCKNRACKSHGKPHPNCRCYGEMAAGGDVEPYCSSDRAHKSDCEYFAEGGLTGQPDFMQPDADPEIVIDPIQEESGTSELPPGVEIDPLPGEEGIVIDPLPGEQEQTTGDRILAGIQGVERGILGPLAEVMAVETGAPWLPDEVQAKLKATNSPDARNALKEMNPTEAGMGEVGGLIAGTVLPIGQGKAIAQGTASAISLGSSKLAAIGAEKAASLAAGSKFLSAAIQGGLIQSSDEVTKWAMGAGDPEDAAGAKFSIGASALFSGLLGSAGGKVSKLASDKLKGLGDAKIGERALSFLRGFGFASKYGDEALRDVDLKKFAAPDPTIQLPAYKNGVAFFDKYFASLGGGLIGSMEGHHRASSAHGSDFMDRMGGAVVGGVLGAGAGYAGRYAGRKAGEKLIGPTVLWALSKNSPYKVAGAIDHVMQLDAGHRLINKTVDGLFSPVAATKGLDSYGHSQLKKNLDTFFGEGGMTQSIKQGLFDESQPDVPFAKGGEVKKTQPKGAIPSPTAVDDGVAEYYPAQNMLLSAGRGRVSNYLMGLRPGKNQPRLPFDAEPDMRKQKKAYDRALDIAISPMRVMDEIKRGTIEADHIKHLNSMYPELLSLLQKRVTTKVTEAQLSGKKPSAKVRQGLSLLLGAPLTSGMTPQAIQAAQAVFSSGLSQPPTKPPQKAPGGTSKTSLTKSDQSFLTGQQAREKRAQRPS